MDTGLVRDTGVKNAARKITKDANEFPDLVDNMTLGCHRRCVLVILAQTSIQSKHFATWS